MLQTKTPSRLLYVTVLPVLILGALWGIFEATVGYALHLLPIRVGFLVWYPVAVFFLTTAYRITGRRGAVLGIAVLAAAIKLLNLLLPGSIDRVINPSVSILLEGIAVFANLFIWEGRKQPQALLSRLVSALLANTLWRLCYLGYLSFLVPAWMREVSVLRSSEALLRFLVIDNGASTGVVFLGMLLAAWLKPHRLSLPSRLPWACRPAHALLAALLIAVNITLQMLL